MTDEAFKNFIHLLTSENKEDWNLGKVMIQNNRELFTVDQVWHLIDYQHSYVFKEVHKTDGWSWELNHYLFDSVKEEISYHTS